MDKDKMINDLGGEVFDLGTENKAYAQYFIGKSYLSMLNTEKVSIANVTFEPGCRNNWHIHHGEGQILLVCGGDGFYQEWGKTPIHLFKGSVVYIPAEVKHWHGASHDSYFAHLAIEIPGDHNHNAWLEAVSDEYYNQLQ